MINGVIALMIGFYLLAVMWGGQQGRMIALISDNAGFLKWIGALLTAAYIYANVDKKTGEVVQGLIVIALAAMILKNGEAMFAEFDKLMSGGTKHENG